MEYTRPQVTIDLEEYLDYQRRMSIDASNINLIRQSFELALALFANNKSKLPGVSLKKILDEKGISLEVNIRNNKTEGIIEDDVQYSLKFKE